MPRLFVQVGLPHRQPHKQSFLRRNGDLSYCITAHPDVGLPYGRYPRLILIWITTEAVRTKRPLLQLGPTLSGFMADLGLIPAGGRWGTIRRLRDQMKRFFSSTIAYTYDAAGGGEWHDTGFRVAEESHLWWQPPNPGQVSPRRPYPAGWCAGGRFPPTLTKPGQCPEGHRYWSSRARRGRSPPR